MEITINKEELTENLKQMFVNNLMASAQQQGLDQEEANAHFVLNRKKIAEDSKNVANMVFAAYGVVDGSEESAE